VRCWYAGLPNPAKAAFRELPARAAQSSAESDAVGEQVASLIMEHDMNRIKLD
jgi:hypothetical protein